MVIDGFSSTLSLAMVTCPSISVAISSSAGEISRQGPHHSAQKSTTTGPEAPSTSLSKLESVTVAGMFNPLAREYGPEGRCPPGQVKQPLPFPRPATLPRHGSAGGEGRFGRDQRRLRDFHQRRSIRPQQRGGDRPLRIQ